MLQLKNIIEAIEEFAPKSLQEDYDNSGIQTGDPGSDIKTVLICLDVTEEVFEEAVARGCNLIISHHPLIFKGVKQLTPDTSTGRILINAVKNGINIYSAHTNLDSASQGVSHEMAHLLNLKDVKVLEPKDSDKSVGLGVTGLTHQPTPKIEFIRKVKEAFNVKHVRFSSLNPQLVVRKVALCGGSGASLIKDAIRTGADMYITGDVKYHDFTTYSNDIIIVDIGHFESELCSEKILQRILKEKFPDLTVYLSAKERNPIDYI